MRAALADRLQSSFNLALGSALASIGPYDTGGGGRYRSFSGCVEPRASAPSSVVMLALTLGVSILTMATGRSTVLAGRRSLVIFAAYIFLTIVP
jgi:Ca2+:H+ antiporter